MFKYIRLFLSLFIRQQHLWWIPLLSCSLKMNSLFSRSTMQLLLLDLPHAYSEDSLLLLVLNPLFSGSHIFLPGFAPLLCERHSPITPDKRYIRNTIFMSTNICNFPGGPVVKILHFHCRGCGFDFWSGKLPEVWPKKKEHEHLQMSLSWHLTV